MKELIGTIDACPWKGNLSGTVPNAVRIHGSLGTLTKTQMPVRLRGLKF
jgi:hypothetical protein